MKCQNCGYYNTSDKNYCVKCGSALEKSPIMQYKKDAKGKSSHKTFNTTEKVIIAIGIIVVLMLVGSAMIPQDFDYKNLFASDNNTQDNNPIVNDTVVQKIDTKISVSSIGIRDGEKIIISAYVSDLDNNPVSSGTVSVPVNDIKYSGNVNNGNVDVELPDLQKENTTVTLRYEGNEKYNPSETVTTIQITRTDTKIDVQTNGNNILATLKTADKDEAIPDQEIIMTYDGNTIREQTDSNGNTNFNINLTKDKTQIKLAFEGNDNYKPCEKIIEMEHQKIDTKLSAQYDDKDNTIIAKLCDEDNNPINNAIIKIKNNETQSIEETDYDGTIEIKLHEGLNNVDLNYEGDQTYNSSNTSITTVIDDNQPENDTIDNNQTNNNTDNTIQTNNTSNNTVIIQDNHSQNNTIQDNNTQNDTDNDTGITQQNDTKRNTTFDTEYNKNNSTVEIQLTDNEKEIIPYEEVQIKLDNGTTLNQRTDSNGTIILELDKDSDIDLIEVIFIGNDKYASSDKYINV